jgi:hypothetical protein
MFHLTNSDKRARCLCGLPLYIENLELCPITVRDIIEIGENQYNSYLMLLIMPDKLFSNLLENLEGINDAELSNINNFDILLLFCNIYSQLEIEILEGFKFFIKRDIKFNKIEGYFEIINENDNFILNKDTYKQFIDIIKLQNYMIKSEDEQKPVNKKAKELLEKQKETRDKINKIKSNNAAPLNISDYISIIISKSYEMDVKKCLDMTIYALFDYIERQALIDNYNVGVKQLLAGAKTEEVNLKHWLSKL